MSNSDIIIIVVVVIQAHKHKATGSKTLERKWKITACVGKRPRSPSVCHEQLLLACWCPLSLTSSTAWWCEMPAVLMATGNNMWVLDSWLYFISILVSRGMVGSLAAAPASLAELTRWNTILELLSPSPFICSRKQYKLKTLIYM